MSGRGPWAVTGGWWVVGTLAVPEMAQMAQMRWPDGRQSAVAAGFPLNFQRSSGAAARHSQWQPRPACSAGQVAVTHALCSDWPGPPSPVLWTPNLQAGSLAQRSARGWPKLLTAPAKRQTTPELRPAIWRFDASLQTCPGSPAPTPAQHRQLAATHTDFFFFSFGVWNNKFHLHLFS